MNTIRIHIIMTYNGFATDMNFIILSWERKGEISAHPIKLTERQLLYFVPVCIVVQTALRWLMRFKIIFISNNVNYQPAMPLPPFSSLPYIHSPLKSFIDLPRIEYLAGSSSTWAEVWVQLLWVVFARRINFFERVAAAKQRSKQVKVTNLHTRWK